jgi:hypothetical protein
MTEDSLTEIRCTGGVIEACGIKLIGSGNTLTGDNCTVRGDNNQITGSRIRVYGNNNIVHGNALVVHGNNNTVTGKAETIIGFGNQQCCNALRVSGSRLTYGPFPSTGVLVTINGTMHKIGKHEVLHVDGTGHVEKTGTLPVVSSSSLSQSPEKRPSDLEIEEPLKRRCSDSLLTTPQ